MNHNWLLMSLPILNTCFFFFVWFALRMEKRTGSKSIKTIALLLNVACWLYYLFAILTVPTKLALNTGILMALVVFNVFPLILIFVFFPETIRRKELGISRKEAFFWSVVLACGIILGLLIAVQMLSLAL